ncbi:interleukin-1 receptor type 1-like [Eleutherodactylus coqui]|uniref:interleukin-1 receptor type 1-like n=1 Tax=Eleutherodactylus coqui TaxID=57060 RepID=UPI0034626482
MLCLLLLFTFHILTSSSLSVGKTELCNDEGTEFEIEYVTAGQPLYALCPLQILLDKNFNITWIKHDSQTEITSDKQTRVHQDQKYLKFIPADLNDSGLYQCILRNSTFCVKKLRRVKVIKHDDGLCYNHSVRFLSRTTIEPSLRIECPNIDIYVKYWNIKVKWFKECQPLDLDSKHYSALGKSLIIKDVSTQDSGNYTCEVPFMYNGVSYNISRTREYSISDIPNEPEAVMVFPTNNVIDVELGAPLTLTCKALYNGTIGLVWTYNETNMALYAEDDRVIMGFTEQTPTEDGMQYFMTLNFTKVIEEDYNRKFYCNIWYFSRSTNFYVTFKKPDPNYQGFLIALFVSLMLVIVIAVIAIRIFKVDIVLWYRNSCFANADQKAADGKIYDAYIIYPKKSTSYEMDIFALKVLPEVLEKQCAYRLFIIGRDDLPGQAMADLVDKTISQSRRVIILLGNIFCEKLGDDFEQKIAMYDALIRNKIKVILIEMEKITDYTDMPESIKYIKQKQGVLRWKGEFTEAALSPNTRFWKNIRYQMPPVQHHYDEELHYIHSGEEMN